MSEWLYGAVDVADNATTIISVPALLKGAIVNTALSSHALPIKDGSNTVFTLPASAAAGNAYEPVTDGSVRCETSLIVDPDDSATGNVTIFYKKLRDI